MFILFMGGIRWWVGLSMGFVGVYVMEKGNFFIGSCGYYDIIMWMMNMRLRIVNRGFRMVIVSFVVLGLIFVVDRSRIWLFFMVVVVEVLCGVNNVVIRIGYVMVMVNVNLFYCCIVIFEESVFVCLVCFIWECDF